MDIKQLEKRNLLQVFNLIITKGNECKGIYELSGIRASQDFDGYSCWLAYKDLTITLLFHGNYDFDYQHKETLDAFFKKISRLLATQHDIKRG